MLRRSGGRCELTQIPFSGQKPDGARMRPWWPSIDRISSREPYTVANCRVVCAYMNLMLNEFGEKAFASAALAYLLLSPKTAQTAPEQNKRGISIVPESAY